MRLISAIHTTDYYNPITHVKYVNLIQEWFNFDFYHIIEKLLTTILLTFRNFARYLQEGNHRKFYFFKFISVANVWPDV